MKSKEYDTHSLTQNLIDDIIDTIKPHMSSVGAIFTHSRLDVEEDLRDVISGYLDEYAEIVIEESMKIDD
jgi:hypothetical protein